MESLIKDERYRENLRKYLRSVLSDKNVVGVVLFGSLARGHQKAFPESDIDLLVIAKSLPADIFKRRMMILDHTKDVFVGVDDIWLTPEELIGGVKGGWGVVLDALADGVILYDAEGVVKNAKALVFRHKRLGSVWMITHE